MTLDEAIKVAEAATPGPCGHCTLPKHGIILPKDGFMASRFWGEMDDSQTANDAEMFALFGTNGLATLRALKMAREAMKAIEWSEDECGQTYCVCCWCANNEDGLHSDECTLGQALTAIAALYPEEAPDAKS